jgi:hypothetical protein
MIIHATLHDGADQKLYALAVRMIIETLRDHNGSSGSPQ